MNAATITVMALLLACAWGCESAEDRSNGDVPDLEVVREPTGFEVIHAVYLFYGIDVWGYEVTLDRGSLSGTVKSMATVATEHKFAISAEGATKLDAAMSGCRFFSLPKEFGTAYPDLGVVTISVEANGFRKTVRTFALPASAVVSTSIDPRQQRVLDFWNTIFATCDSETR